MKNLVDKVKNGARTLAVGAAIGLATLAYSPKAEATLIIGFEDLIPNKGSPTTSQYVRMNYGDNLMIRDLETGIDSIVSKDGTDVWRMGFAKYEGGNLIFGGYANNDNYNSDAFEDYEGWCNGDFYNSVFGDGQAVEDVMIIHDKLGDGIGTLVPADDGTYQFQIDPYDSVYMTNDIMFNGKLGDLGEMPIPTFTGDNYILPEMTIVPEPATLGLLGLGVGALALRGRKRKYVESKVVD